MRLPLVSRRSKTAVVGQDAQGRAEKLLADSLRLLSRVCLKAADVLEAKRLQRQGADRQGKFLERLDRARPADRVR
ncbi:MAG: hypothetical protein L0Y66_24320 [Myxococcaceae bacterium]|nr:hypothetical protein [Myxococcaceae bacterium]MCI0671896.1 hypothetical protein [Myxococcaceae bacterium]